MLPWPPKSNLYLGVVECIDPFDILEGWPHDLGKGAFEDVHDDRSRDGGAVMKLQPRPKLHDQRSTAITGTPRLREPWAWASVVREIDEPLEREKIDDLIQPSLWAR